MGGKRTLATPAIRLAINANDGSLATVSLPIGLVIQSYPQ